MKKYICHLHTHTHTNTHVHEVQTPAFPAWKPAECHGGVETQQAREKVCPEAHWAWLLGGTGHLYLSDTTKKTGNSGYLLGLLGYSCPGLRQRQIQALPP